jgi:hypothetical protein
MTTLTTKQSLLTALRPLSPESVASLAAAWDVRMVHESNAIEGNSLTLRETELVLSKGVTVSGKPLKDHIEALNLSKAWELVKQLAQPGAEINETCLREIAAILGCSKYDFWEGMMVSGVKNMGCQVGAGEAAPEFFGPLLTNLSFNPVEKAAQVHEKIRKFRYFNTDDRKAYSGRISRLATNFVLLAAGYPPLSVPTSLRMEYYNALEAADSGDSQAWLDFLTRQLDQELDEWLAALEPFSTK